MIPEKVRRVLDAHDLSALEFESGSTPTAETAAARLVMIVCAGDRRVSSGAAKRLAGEKLSMANAEETENATGFRPGGVCPFGVEGVDVYIDESLRDWPVVYPAAGNDATGVPTNYGQLLEITGGRTCAVTAAPLPGM